MTVGSVCSGIAAPETAWRGLPFEPLWFAEIDPFPSAVLAHRYPGVPNHGDFTALLRPENRPADVDVLVGGTPCQAFSVAGLRGGLTDPRGNLALAFVALVDVLRPRWVLWENVPGVLSSGGGRDFGAFLGALGHIGYGFAYRVLDAQYFGLAQRRKRVFVVASPGDWTGPAAVLSQPEGVRWDSPPRRRPRAGVAGSPGTGASDGGGWRVGADEAAAGHVVPGDRGRDDDRVDVEPPEGVSIGNGADEPMTFAWQVTGTERTLGTGGLAVLTAGDRGVSVDQAAGGQAVMAFGGNNPDALDVATACNAKGGAGRMDFESETFVAHTLRGSGHDASEDGTGRGVPLVPVAEGGFYACAGSQSPSWREGTAPTLKLSSSPAHAHAATTRHGVRRLTPREMERLQGFPDLWTLLPVALRKPIEDEYAAYLATMCPGLTREELERLSKDGPRAKALGNSMAVPVLRWLGERILKADALARSAA